MSSDIGRTSKGTISLAHGAGGKAMHDLIEQVFLRRFDNPLLRPLEDQARVDLASLAAQGDRLALTTDSFVVDPLFFPGGDIGRLAVCGTVNDLAVGGARPLFLTCGFIIEEGLEINVLERIVASMRATSLEAGIDVVAGDTKVVERGQADKVFINTTGIGVVPPGIDSAAVNARPGDRVIVSGPLGDHGIAILAARGQLDFATTLVSDCQPLGDLVAAMLNAAPQIRAMRDITRGGLGTVLNEIARASKCWIEIDETSLPLRAEVRSAAELLGLDVLYLACEGALAAIVPPAATDRVLSVMRQHPHGRDAQVVGAVRAEGSVGVTMRTALGGKRAVDTLIGEQLPRIC
jgi:hydrogenase expression/formation protein HypE